MKKHILMTMIIGLMPTITFGGNYRIEELLSQKQGKIERLEKCHGTTKGLKIAGLSTLGLTAVGVSVNIAEASKIKTNTTNINATQQRIEQTKKEIEKKLTSPTEQEQLNYVTDCGANVNDYCKFNTSATTGNNKIDLDLDGTEYKALNLNDLCSVYDDVDGESEGLDKSHCTGLAKGEWIVKFDYGTIKGTSQCATNDGIYAESGNPSGSNGKYCWCKATDIAGTNQSYDWVYNSDWECVSLCASFCASDVLFNARATGKGKGFRGALFGVSQ